MRAKALQNGEEVVSNLGLYAQGQAAFDESRTHGFHYVDHNEYAKVGRQHIYPFMQNLDTILSDRVSSIVNPGQQSVTFITNRNDTPSWIYLNVLDNNASTEIVYKTPNTITDGTYVGISYTKAIDIDKVTFKLGQMEI